MLTERYAGPEVVAVNYDMKAEQQSERLIDAALMAESDLATARKRLTDLNNYRIREGANMPTDEFMKLVAKMEQAKIDVEQKTNIALQAAAARDQYLEQQRAKLAKDCALNELKAVTQEFETTRQTLLKQEAELKALYEAVKFGSQRHSDLLFKLNQAKIKAKELGILEA